MTQRPQVMRLKVPHSPAPRHQLPQRAGWMPTWAARIGHVAQAELIHARHTVAVGAAGHCHQVQPIHVGQLGVRSPHCSSTQTGPTPNPLSSRTAAPSKGSPPPLTEPPHSQPKATES